MYDVVNSLLHVAAFSHAKCDAILLRSNIEIPGAFEPGKPLPERDSVYTGFAFAVVWEIIVAIVTRASYLPKNRGTRLGQARPVLLLFVIFGIFCFALQLAAMASYSDECRKLLR